MSDPTVLVAMSVQCKRCGGMPAGMSGVSPVYANHILYCRTCGVPTDPHVLIPDAARQWIDMNKEATDGEA
jgi:hypothetical protein